MASTLLSIARHDRIACWTGLILLLLADGSLQAKGPDLILRNGKIVTVDANFTVADSLAIQDGRILAVGKFDDIKTLGTENTLLLDLGGKTVLPGLIDSHVHPVAASTYEFDHPIPEMDTIADVLQYIAARAAIVEAGQWIVIRQVFITRLRDQRYPTRQELDRVAPSHPVMFATGPDASLNSLALSRSGINRDFQITDGGPGRIERDPDTGEPTGILRSCTRLVKSGPTGKSPSEAEQLLQLKRLLADYNSVGITSIADRDTSDDAVSLHTKLRDRGELTCRVFMNLSVDAQQPLDKITQRIEQAAAHPLHAYDNRLWLRGIKCYLDGGMLTGSAYMKQPWGVSRIYSITDPDYRGLRFIDPEKLTAIARLALEHDLQMTAHSVGDGAVQTLIDAYAAINRDLPVRDRRPCITHCNFLSASAIDQMRDLGIVADLQPAWLWLDGQTLLTQFGQERLAYFQPYRTLFERGVIIGGGSDHMQKIGSLRSVNPYNPFLGMWIALTRSPRRSDGPLHPEQKLTREQALRLYTINNAYLTFEEREKGSLEVGKLADFVILNQDFLTCPEDEIKDLTVYRTYLGGKIVYRSAAVR
ncbi:MAG: amidohydrolase [Planctomycetes bacterium]|nr:amidohydrolase [Planctomycetota bacterium]